MKKSFYLLYVFFLCILGFISCDIGITTPKQDVEVQIQYYFQNIENDEYTLGKIETVEVEAGSLTDIKAPSVKGFIAKDIEQVKAKNDETTIPIYYDRVTSTITLHANQGSFNGKDKIQLQGRYEQVIDYQFPTKKNYVFSEWTDKKGNSLQITKFEEKSINLYASWKNIIYSNITFQLCYGEWKEEFIVPAKYKEGVETELPVFEKDFVRTGYIFDGWYTDDKYTPTNRIEKIEKSMIGDITVYAKWIPANNTPYKVVHKVQTLDKQNYIIDTIENKTGTTGNYTVAEPKTYEGFIAETVIQKQIKEDGLTSIEILYNRKTITVTYIDGNETKIINGTFESSLEPPVFIKSGYTTIYNTNLTKYPSSDVSVNVSYKPNTDTVYSVITKTQNIDGTYSITNMEGKGTTDTTTVVIAPEISGFLSPVIQQTNIDGDGKSIAYVMYNRKTITVTYYDGNVEQNISDLYGKSLTPPEFSKDGFTTVYSQNLSSYPSSDTSVSVRYERKIITVTYSDGVSTTTVKGLYERSLTPPEFSKEGFTTVYSPNLSSYPSSDTSVSVRYERKTIAVTYSDGISTKTVKGLYGNVIDKPTCFTMKGYSTNLGILEKFPAKDTFVFVTYENNSDVIVDKSWEIHSPHYAYLTITKKTGYAFMSGNTIYCRYGSVLDIEYSGSSYSESAQGGWYAISPSYSGPTSGIHSIYNSQTITISKIEQRSSTNESPKTNLAIYKICILNY